MQWCLDNLGPEQVRWWFEDDVLGLAPGSSPVLVIDVTEEEKINLTFFILQYGQQS